MIKVNPNFHNYPLYPSDSLSTPSDQKPQPQETLQEPPSVQQEQKMESTTPVASTGFFQDIGDKFLGFFRWVTDWITGGFKSTEPAPYQLTPEQEQKIQEIYYEASRILREMDQPEAREEVRNFLKLLLAFYKRQSEQLKDQAASENGAFEITRKKTMEHKKKEQEEYDKMLKEAASSNFWQKLNKACVPLYTMVGAMAVLPPGLNVAVVCAAFILAMDDLAGHPIKESIAEGLAKGDREQSAAHQRHLELFSSIVSFGLAIPTGMSSFPLAMVLGLVKAGTGIGRTVTEQQKKNHEGELTLLKNEAIKWERKLNDQLGNLKTVNQSHQRLTEISHRIIEDQHRTASGLFRGG